jgi:putative flippase GtrA
MRPAFLDEFWRLTRFSMVGAVATVIHVAVAMFVVSSTDMRPTLGSIVGFFAAFTFSYLGHFRFTFAVVGRHRYCPWFSGVVLFEYNRCLGMYSDPQN